MQVDVAPYREEHGSSISAVQRALIIKSFPGFAGLDAAGLATMASVTRERFFHAGETMLTPGTPVVAFYLIVEGEAQMYRDGKKTRAFGPKSAIGGLGALTRDPKGAHATAISDVLALEIDTEDMQDVFEDNYRILLGVLTAMTATLRELQQAVGGGAAISAKRDVAPIEKDGELSLVEKMFFLRRTNNFSHARVEALADLAEGAFEKSYDAGETLWSAGDDADYSVIILTGTVECSGDGSDPFEFGPGMVVGGLDSLARQPRWYGCTAKEPVRLLVLRRTALFDTLEDHIDMAMELMRNLAGGVTGLLARLAG